MPDTSFTAPGDAGICAQAGAQEQVPQVVQEAQLELDRLMDLLSEPPRIEDVPSASRRIGSKSGIEEEAGRATSRSAGMVAMTGCVDEVCPLYLIISSRQALKEKYGRLGMERLDSDLRELRQAVEYRGDVEPVVLYVDDEQSLERYGLEPVNPANAYEIKILLDKVDAHLADVGREVRYLLIIGGDEIIPFHRLPNPVEDQDAFVPSDNPYACRGKNYLLPDRAVGRLPDGDSQTRGYRPTPTDGASIGFLHSLIQTAAQGHQNRVVSKGWRDALGSVLHLLNPKHMNGHGLGYSASIWRKASRAVFSTIGEENQLRTSPPLTYEDFRIVGRPTFSYFNLHGVEDGPNWYGQRDSLFPADYPLFPLALRPQDLGVDGCADSVVLTEACYGANILGKNASNSIALRFLAGSALVVVGSTKVAYGSLAPPLLGADLIGKYFWEGLQARLTAGDALKYAKVNLVREMQQRQGYLDGEDQKALISFVLYGDPLLPIMAVQQRTPAEALTQSLCPAIICGRETEVQSGVLSDELVASVKSCIETNLPHMTYAQVRAKPVGLCRGATDVASASLPRSCEGDWPWSGRGRWALTLVKDVPVEGGDGQQGRLPLHQVVRAIVDGNGHILKLAVSR